MTKEDCQHDERVWIFEGKLKTTYLGQKIGIKTKCRSCGVIGYEVYDFSTFQVDELENRRNRL